jgi:hypothetical protein
LTTEVRRPRKEKAASGVRKRSSWPRAPSATLAIQFDDSRDTEIQDLIASFYQKWVMRGDDHKSIAGHVSQNVRDRACRFSVEAGRGFVGKDNRSRRTYCPCQRYALCFAPGQVGREIAAAIFESNLFQGAQRSEFRDSKLEAH